MSKERSVIFVKTRISFGGASFSGLELLSLFGNQKNKIRIITGYIDPRIRREAVKSHNFKVQVFRPLDRYFKSYKNPGQREKEVTHFILRNTNLEDILVISQPFLGDGLFFSKATVNLTYQRPSLLRLHDPIEDKINFAKISPTTIGIPTTYIMAHWMKSIKKNIKSIVVPSIINFNSLKSSRQEALNLRRKHRIRNTDFLIFQPTRVSARKNIGRTIRLAHRLSTHLDPRRVFLIIAGGKEKGQRKKMEKARLKILANKLNFKNIVFLNNTTPGATASYMRAANLITFLSKTESWGRVPAESAVVGTPCLTTRYKDENGKDVFSEVYKGFKFIIEPDPNKNTISKNVLREVVKLAENPFRWGKNARVNHRLVTKYDRRNWRGTISKIVRALA